MKTKTQRWRTALIFAIATEAAFAQDQPRLTLEFQSQEDLQLSEQPTKLDIDLPYSFLETLVSDDGQQIVQYGDQLDRLHPTRTNIFWIDRNGGVMASVTDRFAEEAFVAMSGNGWTAAAGRLHDDREKYIADLYDKSGERAWEITLPDDQRFSLLAVAQSGERTVFGTSHRARRLEEHALHVVNDSGEIISSIEGLGMIQKVVVINGGKDVFVQGYDEYGLIEADGGFLRWRRAGKIRMVSPHGARTDAAGDVLFLMLADFKGRPQPTYRWNLLALDAVDGARIQSVWLPEEYPGTVDHVFESITDERLELRVGARRLIYSWLRTKEEKR